MFLIKLEEKNKSMKHLERALDNQNQWWKYLVVFLVGIIGAQIIGGIPLAVVLGFKSASNGADVQSLAADNMDFAAYGIDLNVGLILIMIPFILGLFFIAKMFKPMHNRSLKEVINGTKSIRWNRFFFAALVWGAIAILVLVVDYSLAPDNFAMNFNLSAFIPLILISIILIPLQTTFEEVLFRGYLTQGVAAWTKSRWIAVIIPALVFALMHTANPEVKEYGFWLAMPQYVLFGLIFGLITILDDGIELAMGAHAANNIFCSVFVTTKASALQTPALFEQLSVNPTKETFVLFIIGTVLITILALKYKWDFSVLNKRINVPVLK